MHTRYQKVVMGQNLPRTFLGTFIWSFIRKDSYKIYSSYQLSYAMGIFPMEFHTKLAHALRGFGTHLALEWSIRITRWWCLCCGRWLSRSAGSDGLFVMFSHVEHEVLRKGEGLLTNLQEFKNYVIKNYVYSNFTSQDP